MSVEKQNSGMTRRDMFKISGAALGGLAFSGPLVCPKTAKAQLQCPTGECYPVAPDTTQRYSYFESLPDFRPFKDRKLEADEMRITFLGSMFPPPRRAQQEMSVFVEVGWDDENDRPLDQFVFDCGSGVSANYGAMGIGYGRMDKIFISHLHADHMGDLGHIYCFGPSGDRKSPLYVWGPGPSGVKSPRPPRRLYDDGTRAFCKNLREAMRWHTESFSFQSTSYVDYDAPTRKSWGLPSDPVPVGDDPSKDGYALIPIELDWKNSGKVPGDNVAYHNPKTRVKITHFPVIHTRKGSIGYKLEWEFREGRFLRMIYTSDTRPETNCIEQAVNGGEGVDVLIHEMIVPAEVYAMKTLRLPEPLPYPGPDLWKKAVDDITRVQKSSHTPQGAFGYLLSQIYPFLPRLAVATHFPVADDTVACAIESVREHVPDIKWSEKYDPSHNITWSFDLMVIKVTEKDIAQCKGVVSEYGWSPFPRIEGDLDTPKYWTWDVDEDGNPVKVGDPRAQIDVTTEIPATNDDGTENYCENGY